MGRDKATMPFHGRSMIEIALEKLHTLCRDVSIAGNRADLVGFAPVIRDWRLNSGPAAAVESGLRSSTQPWVLFIPVDVPLVPVEILWLWAEKALREDVSVSYLGILGCQPTFCLLKCGRQAAFSTLLDKGNRHLGRILNCVAEPYIDACRVFDEHDLYGYQPYTGPDRAVLKRWFTNLNTPHDLTGT